MNARLFALLMTSALMAAGGQVMFKLGATGRSSLLSFVNGWILLGLVAYGTSTALWIFALSRAPLTVVYPFTALTFVLAYTAGLVIFREHVSMAAMAGVALILSGLYLTQLR